jgi:hypothetical protein
MSARLLADGRSTPSKIFFLIAVIFGATLVLNKHSAIFQTFCAKTWQNNVGSLPTAHRRQEKNKKNLP